MSLRDLLSYNIEEVIIVFKIVLELIFSLSLDAENCGLCYFPCVKAINSRHSSIVWLISIAIVQLLYLCELLTSKLLVLQVGGS